VKFTRPRKHIPDFPRRRFVFRSLTVLLLVSAGIAFLVFGGKHTSDANAISLTQLVQLIKEDRIVALEASDAGGWATDRSGEVFSLSTQRDESILKVLLNLGASPNELSRIAYTVADPPAPWLNRLLGIGSLLLFAVFGVVAWRRFASRGQNPMQSFGQTRARIADSAQSTITFADVAGIDEPLQELQEVVEFLKEPQKFAVLGARCSDSARCAAGRSARYG
jgi:ATP-dependent Zn protease